MADTGKSKGNNALVLSCMDLRVVDDVVDYFHGLQTETDRSLQNQFDFVTFAGAALGATTPLRPGWGEMFWEHVALAIELHHVTQVYIVEHQDCGAYKKLHSPEEERAVIGDWARRDVERQIHHRVASELRSQIEKKYGQQLAVHLLYAELESKGSVDAHIGELKG